MTDGNGNLSYTCFLNRLVLSKIYKLLTFTVTLSFQQVQQCNTKQITTRWVYTLKGREEESNQAPSQIYATNEQVKAFIKPI